MNVERTLLKYLGWPVHRLTLRLSGGRLGTTQAGETKVGTLALTTTGRKSGQPRTVPLYFMPDGDTLVVLASNAGDDRDPVWLLNLRAKPDGVVQLAGERFEVTVREAEGPERERLWPLMLKGNPRYAAYQKRRSQPIPVVVLERR